MNLISGKKVLAIYKGWKDARKGVFWWFKNKSIIDRLIVFVDMFLEFIVLFILLCFLSFIPTKKNRDINIVFSSVGLLLFLFAAF